MSKLDEIFKLYVLRDDLRAGEVAHKHQFKTEVKQLIKELIGEDYDISLHKPLSKLRYADDAVNRELAELRKKVEEL